MIEAIATNGYTPDAVRKSCYDCRHCKAAVTWWCTNQDAINRRGTQIPCATSCENWEPIRKYSDLKFRERLFGSLNFVEIGEKK